MLAGKRPLEMVGLAAEVHARRKAVDIGVREHTHAVVQVHEHEGNVDDVLVHARNDHAILAEVRQYVHIVRVQCVDVRQVVHVVLVQRVDRVHLVEDRVVGDVHAIVEYQEVPWSVHSAQEIPTTVVEAEPELEASPIEACL